MSTRIKKLSRELGNKTVKNKSTSKGKSGHSTNTSEIGKPLMPAEEILALGKTKEIITSEARKPIQANKIFWYKEKLFSERANRPIPAIPNLGNLLSRMDEENPVDFFKEEKPQEQPLEKEDETTEDLLDLI